ncbi:MAG: hypothetical protein JWM47_4516 [Acidimicrobiales bacterium]|nr:hypothetical protein [Acidimicrobiales bacterium]
MTRKDELRCEALIGQADECRSLAAQALKDNSPVGYREWMEAHDAARRAVNTIKYPTAVGNFDG